MNEITAGNHRRIAFERALIHKAQPENVTIIQKEELLPFEIRDALADTMITMGVQDAKKADGEQLAEVRREIALLQQANGFAEAPKD